MLLCFTAVLVRLVPGSKSGRVEVLHNDIWGTVCIVNFDHNEANVLCKMMGFKYSTTTHTGNPGKKFHQEVPSCPARRGTYGRLSAGKGKIWLSDLRCKGKEEDIFSCPQAEIGVNNCTHRQDVSLYCV